MDVIGFQGAIRREKMFSHHRSQESDKHSAPLSRVYSNCVGLSKIVASQQQLHFARAHAICITYRMSCRAEREKEREIEGGRERGSREHNKKERARFSQKKINQGSGTTFCLFFCLHAVGRSARALRTYSIIESL